MKFAPSKTPIAAQNGSNRIIMLDALRGFTLFLILLLHSVLKFHYWTEVSETYITFPLLDKYILKFVFFTTSGKAYTLFSFFLGFGYFLQFSARVKKGEDYCWRYIWRLAILLVFGVINIGLYLGDILILYALVAPILVITRHWKDKNILILSVILLACPFEWFVLLKYILIPESGLLYEFFGFVEGDFYEANSFLENLRYNLVPSIKYNLLWYFNDGRVFQAPGLFLLGVIAGRKKILTRTNISFYNKSIGFTVVLVFVMYFLRKYISVKIEDATINKLLFSNLTHIYNLLFSASMLFIFIRVWHTSFGEKLFKPLAIYGKMSLSNYIFQSVLGFLVFSGFGLSLSAISGNTLSFAIGLLIFFVQITFSMLYSKKHTYGPFEYIWRKLTWIKVPSRIFYRSQVSV